MSRLVCAFLVFLAGYLTLAQPGLCPCWLIGNVEEYHPHPGDDPESAHAHDYLFELFPAGNPAVNDSPLVPASLFIGWLVTASLWLPQAHWATRQRSWLAPPPAPPPRLAA